MKGKAVYLKSGTSGTGADQRVYRLEPPYVYETRTIEHIVVSGVYAMFSGPETYIFESDAEGEVLDWGELPGSFQGYIDHDAALRGLGYEAAEHESA